MMFSAWFGGFKPGLLSLALSLVAFHYFFLLPIHQLHLGTQVPRLCAAALASFWVVWLSASQRTASESLKRSRDALNESVHELSRINESLQEENAERKRTEALLEGQKHVLEMMACGAPLSDSLAALTLLIEGRVPGMLGSILLLDQHGTCLHHGAAPSLPPEYVAAIDGKPIGPEAGSCGTAAFTKEPVFVEDIATDPRWKDYRAVALPHGLRACWSKPILDSQRRVLGTFAMYYRQPGLPKPEHLRLIELATHIAAIAISAHRVQAVLRESEAKLKEAQRLAKIGYWERDLITNRITWTEETYRIFGQPKGLESLTSAKLQELIHPDDRTLQSEALRDVLEKGRKYDVEYRILLPDGQIRFLHAWDEIECDASGRPIRIFGTVQDITERKETDAALRSSEARKTAILNSALDCIVTINHEGCITEFNPAAERTFGYRREEVMGKHLADVMIPPSLREEHRRGFARYLATGESRVLGKRIEMTAMRADGSEFPVELAITRIPLEGPPSFTGYLRDITDRKLAESRLFAQAQEIRAIVENSPDFIVRFDRQLRRTFVNAAFIKGNGVPKEQLLGREIASAANDGVVKATSEEIATLEHALNRVHETGQPLDFESVWPLMTGRRIFAVHMEPEFDARGVFTSILAISRDMTDRMESENKLRVSREQLRALTARLESSREEEATRIARDIHDDLGQKLTALKMDLLRAERMAEGIETSPAVNALLDTLVRATELADGITASVQEIAANLRPEMLDKLGLGAALHFESRRFQERTGMACEFRLPETEPSVSTEVSNALFRIFQECLTNIVRHAHATKIEVALEIEDGGLALRVQDNGRGITEAEMNDPKSLGLLGMKERTTLLGGEIVIGHPPEGGTSVWVRIPQNQAIEQPLGAKIQRIV